MEKSKKVLSILLALMLVITLIPTTAVYASDNGDYLADTVTLDDEALSDQLYKEVFGDGGDYEVFQVEMDVENNQFSIDYSALTDTALHFSLIDEESGQPFEIQIIPVSAGQSTLLIDWQVINLPKYFRAEAYLESGGDTYVYAMYMQITLRHTSSF